MMITAPPFFTIETERHQIIQTVLRPTSNNLMETQLDELQQQYCHFLKANELTEEDLFFAKAFVSDFLNQKEGIHSHPLFVKYFNNCGLSIVEQPPLDGNKVNIMLLFVKGAAIRKERKGDVFYAETSDHLHLFQSIPCFSPVDQLERGTEQLFEQHQETLARHGMSVADNCMRTWLYVRDVDKDYGPVVEGRNTFFRKNGLTADTHFIASTGIEGAGNAIDMPLYTEFYSVKGLQPEQVKYLNAREYLNPTHEYGVAFERGVWINYPQLQCTFISGTASIDKHGDCIHQGDAIKQLERIFLNMEQLLLDADATLSDIAHLIVYLRDVSDYKSVNEWIAHHYGEVPTVIVQAKVCRPQWLLEIECMALKR